MGKLDAGQCDGRTRERLEEDRGVRYDDAALGHHRHEISVAQPVADVPPDAQLDDFGIEAATSANGIPDDGLGHFGCPVDAKIVRQCP